VPRGNALVSGLAQALNSVALSQNVAARHAHLSPILLVVKHAPNGASAIATVLLAKHADATA
jgi:hypothetical protein